MTNVDTVRFRLLRDDPEPPKPDGSASRIGLQDSKGGMHDGTLRADGKLQFEFELAVKEGPDPERPVFTGPFASGPRDERFVYLSWQRLDGSGYVNRIKARLTDLDWPLETGNVSVARANAHVNFPARVQLIAAMNPCGRVAMLLPGVPMRVGTLKPSMIALRRDTLGAKLKRRRLELGLRQRDVAKQMGVCLESVLGWENGKKAPMASQYPAILSFLGYEPWPEPQTLGDKLRAERRRRGLSVKLAAAFLKIDEGTFTGWERGSRNPIRQSRRICDRFLNSSAGGA